MSRFTSVSAILALFLIFSQVPSYSQSSPSFAGVRYGSSLPMGELASHDFGNGGYALLGKTYGIDGAWFFTPHLGIGASLSTAEYGFAYGFYADDYLESEPAFSNMLIHSGNYRINNYLAGLYWHQDWTDRFSTNAKLLGGIAKASTPDLFFNVDAEMVGNMSFMKTSATDYCPAMLAGVSLGYRVYDHVTLSLQADFSYAEPGFYFSTGYNFGYTDFMQMPVFNLQPGVNINF
jgi:hypothetical protein